MASPVVNIATNAMSGLASAIHTFVGLMLVSAVLAFFAARKWGRTKRARRAVYSVVGFFGLVIAVIVMQYRVRHIGQ
jgi:sulfite exporter TauE/SafE